MARYRKIDVRIWNDRKFRQLDDKAKLAFILLLTHPYTNQLGLIRTRSVSLALDLGWDSNAMSDAIQKLCDFGMLMADEKAGLMFIPNFLKYNPPNGVNGAKSWDGLLDLLPECELLDKALCHVKSFVDGLSQGIKAGIPNDIKKALKRSSDAIEHAIQDGSRIQEQEQEQDIYKEETYVSSRGFSFENSTPTTASDALEKVESPQDGKHDPASTAATGADNPADKPHRKAAAVPYEKIVDLYNAKLGPVLGMCRDLNAARRSALKSRWTDVATAIGASPYDTADVLEGFGAYFDKISRSDFLMGRRSERGWRATFDWIVKSGNYLKIFEGNYENGRR